LQKPHPEGGHYSEDVRDTRSTPNGRRCRPRLFLLARGERSHWLASTRREICIITLGRRAILQIEMMGARGAAAP